MVMDAVAFQQGAWADHLRMGDQIDVVFQLETNEWQGRQSLQMNVQDMRLAGSGPAIEVAVPPKE